MGKSFKIKKMRKIITHINPDLDAVVSVWLIKRFLPGWEEAEIDFVTADSSTEQNSGADADPDILYVDVGRGKLDHHQTGDYLSATKLCWNYVLAAREQKQFSPLEKKALEELVKVVTQIDNARDLKWEEINQSRYTFYLHNLLDGLRGLAETDRQIIEFGFRALDAVLLNLKNQIKADEELQEGTKFQTPWGQGIAIEIGNKSVLLRGEVQGYAVVVKKDPKTGGVQIYSRWDKGVNLTEVYNKFREMDSEADWFLHATKRLLLNQASVNPNMRPTKLSLKEIIKSLTIPDCK